MVEVEVVEMNRDRGMRGRGWAERVGRRGYMGWTSRLFGSRFEECEAGRGYREGGKGMRYTKYNQKGEMNMRNSTRSQLSRGTRSTGTWREREGEKERTRDREMRWRREVEEGGLAPGIE